MDGGGATTAIGDVTASRADEHEEPQPARLCQRGRRSPPGGLVGACQRASEVGKSLSGFLKGTALVHMAELGVSPLSSYQCRALLSDSALAQLAVQRRRISDLVAVSCCSSTVKL